MLRIQSLRPIVRLSCLVFVIFYCQWPVDLAAAYEENPNIVLVLADDLGWGDPQSYQSDSKIPTPSIDRLASEGIRFTDAHSPSSVCTPTRYGLMTGRYAWRTRLKNGVLDGFDPALLGENEDNLARMLKRVGYQTHCVGKWHLGMQWTGKDGKPIDNRIVANGFRQGLDVDFSIPTTGGPLDVGFDTYFGISASLDMSPYSFIRGNRVTAIPNMITSEDRDGMFMNQVPGVTDEVFRYEDVLPRIALEASTIIKQSENEATPFFLYVPLASPHLPVVPNQEWIGKSDAGKYGDFVAATDHALGEILGALDETGQTGNTLVIFTSDNGGLFHWWDFRADDDGGAAPRTDRGDEVRRFAHQSNADWRGTKADIFEGGHRVPFLVRWPGKTEMGKVVSATVELTDVFATLSDLVGEAGQGTSGMDSFSMLPLFNGEADSIRPFAIHHSSRGLFAIRSGDWKLIDGHGSGGFTQPRYLQDSEEDGQLYNLATDPQETKNLFAEEGSRVDSMIRLLNHVKSSSGVEAANDLALSPEETALGAIAPVGFTVDVIASEPDIGQPIAMSWDHFGRLWIAECNTYSERTVNFDMTESDRIVVLADKDGNGSFETKTVFAENLQRLTSVAVGFGGVWALTSPTLVFIPDADGDLIPDGPAVTMLNGFDIKYTRHTIANGLKWGPDGWLYGRHGIVATSEIGPPGAPSSERARINTAIWRFHPKTGKTEAWTHGGTNPWGHDWNADGDLFYINTVIGHFWHGIPNGFTKRMFGRHERPYLYRLLDQHADHWHFDIYGDWTDTRQDVDKEDAYGGGHAHTGLMIYQGDKWPAEYRNDVYTLNFHGRRLNRESLPQEGSGFVAKHKPDFVKFPDRWFRGIDLGQGPDGDVYVLDWSDTGECHDHDGIHRNSGRVYRIRYGDTESGPEALPKTFSELDTWFRNPNVWYARRARLMIQEAAANGTLSLEWKEGLKGRFSGERDAELALRYFHALHAAGLSNPEAVLKDERETLRSQAVLLLRETGLSDSSSVNQLVKMSRGDTARVRLAIASLLPLLETDSQIRIAEALVAHAEDAGDHNYPLMVWYAIEPLVALGNLTTLTHLLSACQIPELRKFIARRIAEDYDGKRSLISDLILAQPKYAGIHLQGVADALRGMPKAEPLEGWKRIAGFASGEGVVDQLGAIFGDGQSLDNLFAFASDLDADPNVRRRAVQSLGQSKYPDIKVHLQKWIEDSQLAGESAKALARFPDPVVGELIVQRLNFMKFEERATAIDTLVTRVPWAHEVLDGIESKRFTPSILSTVHARQIVQLNDPELTKRLSALWGDVNLSGEDPSASVIEEKLRKLFASDSLQSADLSAGRQWYDQICSSCHQLYGNGGQIGPDITGSGRHELDYLIENILYPSAVVPAGYRMTILKLKDGRTLSGIIAAESEKRIILKTVGSDDATYFSPEDVDSRETLNQSLMPAGLLNGLEDKALIDLIGYLMGEHQAPLRE